MRVAPVRRRTNPNEVTYNILAMRGRHRYTRGTPGEFSGTTRPQQPKRATSKRQHTRGTPGEFSGTTQPQQPKRATSKRQLLSHQDPPDSLPAAKDILHPVKAETPKVLLQQSIKNHGGMTLTMNNNDSRGAIEYNCLPSHSKVASVVAKCLAHNEGEIFTEHFLKSTLLQPNTPADWTKERESIVNQFGICCKTPILLILRSLRFVYGIDNVECRRLGPDETISHGSNTPPNGRVALSFYLLDCILDRRISYKRGSVDTRTNTRQRWNSSIKSHLPRAYNSETVPKVPCYKREDLEVDNDYKFRSAVTVVPDAATFYTCMERYDEAVTAGLSLIPMGISWLRLLGTKKGWFAAGGYVRYLSEGSGSGMPTPMASSARASAWLIQIFPTGERDTLRRMNAWHIPDIYGPCWPPDIFPTDAMVDGQMGDTTLQRRKKYMQLLQSSPTAKLGCRWHVAGALYGQLSDDALVIDPTILGACDVVVTVQQSGDELFGIGFAKKRDLSVACESIISIRHLDPGKDRKIARCLYAISRNADTIRRGNNTGKVRDDIGEHGSMYALGCRVNPQTFDNIVPYAANKRVAHLCLPEAVDAMAYIGGVAFPNIVRPIQDMERAAGCQSCLPCMEKLHKAKHVCTTTKNTGETAVRQSSRVGLTMDVSCNLHNSAHYDVNDATPGYAVWTESRPGQAKFWYFILPQVYGRRADGSTYNGIAIKLTHGVAISWDGRRIKHCTAVERVIKGDTNYRYGTFCGAKTSLVKLGLKGNGSLAVQQGTISEGDVGSQPCADLVELKIPMSYRIPRKPGLPSRFDGSPI